MDRLSGRTSKKILKQENPHITKITSYIKDELEKIENNKGILGYSIFRIEDLTIFLNKIIAELPDELQTAMDIIEQKDNILQSANAQRESIIEDAQRQSKGIISAAEEQAELLVSDTYVMKKANKMANDAIMEADEEAKEIISYVNNYAYSAFDGIISGIDSIQQEAAELRDKIIKKLNDSEKRLSVSEDTSYNKKINDYSSKNDYVSEQLSHDSYDDDDDNPYNDYN